MTDCGTILVVDHDETTRSAATLVARRLGYHVSAFTTGDGLPEVLDGDRPALAIVEVDLPGESSGLELLRELHDTFGDDCPVILVSADRTSALDCVAGFMLGADDYITKPFDTGEFLARIRRSLRRAGNGNGNAKPRNTLNLSPREREILALLADGKTQKQIAAALVISPKTVATHIQHLLGKLGVHSRTQAVAQAFQLGLVEPDVTAHILVATPAADDA